MMQTSPTSRKLIKMDNFHKNCPIWLKFGMQVTYHPCHYRPCPPLLPLLTHSVADPNTFQIFSPHPNPYHHPNVTELIKMTRDANELVRKTAYVTLTEKVGLKGFSISRRISLLKNGFQVEWVNGKKMDSS